MGYVNTRKDLIEHGVSLGFDDIYLDQGICIVKSREEVNTESEVIRGIKLRCPIIGSNMTSVMSADFAIKLYELGGLGVLHRAYKDFDTYLSEVTKVAKQCHWVCASIGVGENAFNQFKTLRNCGTNVIFIDIAHGYQYRVFELAMKIKDFDPETKVVIGNFINPDALYDIATLEDKDFTSIINSIDALKIGIGGGAACSTSFTAGCGMSQFSAIIRCSEIARTFKIPVIADGGISRPDHFCKAIAAGANSIMCGKILAACPESPSEKVLIGEPNNEVVRKKYYGMMSRISQETWHGKVKNDCPEGRIEYLPVGESVDLLLTRYQGALRSGISYAGANDIESFHNNVRFIRTK